MRTRLILTALFTLALALAPALAQSAAEDTEQTACRRLFDPELIKVTALPVQPSVDVSLDTRALTTLEGKPTGQRVLGRTTARLRNSSAYKTRIQKLPGGRICARPGVTVTLSYEPTIIFVGSEYPAGSCEYRKIIDHEQRHVAMHILHLEELTPLLQADLREFYAHATLVFDLPASALQYFQTGTQSVIRARIKQMSGDARARQEGVDSSEEIGKMSTLRKLCATESAPPSGGR